LILTLPLALAWYRSMNADRDARVDDEAPRAEHA
jgi:hypothetical protein